MITEVETQIEVRTQISERSGGLVGRVAAAGAALVSIGERLGSHDTLSASPRAAAELVRCSGTSEEFVKDWLVAKAADNYTFFPGTGRYADLFSGPRSS